MRAAIIVALAAACGGGGSKQTEPPHQEPETLSNNQPAPPPPDAAPPRARSVIMAKMAEFRDAMCTCHDPNCAKRVSDEMTAWSKETSTLPESKTPMTEETRKDAVAIGIAMSECMQTAMGMGSGSTP